MDSRRAAFICLGLVLIGFLAFVFYLDRYPPPYYDEGAYNQPALRTLDGLSFNWPMAASAPYGTVVWAYHGPFFPHLQILTFRLLGVSAFAMRIPQFTGAFLAILLLCGTLIRFHCPWSAILLAVFWLGDRSLVEALYGRTDGIALLFLACTFGQFAQWLSSGRSRTVFWTGFFAGTALGFHPVTWPFMLAIGAAILYLAPPGERRQVLYYGLGLALPGVTWLAFLAPHFVESVAQFRWFSHLARDVGFAGRIANLVSVLRWSRYWAIALAAVAILFVLPSMAIRLLGYRKRAVRPSPVVLAAGLFALSGLVSLLTSVLFPYYLIFFSVWPTIAVLVVLETEGRGQRFSKPAFAALIVLALGWLPSAAWNAMRWREARILYPKLDPSSFVPRLRAAIPANAPFEVSPEYFIMVRPMGHDMVRPPVSPANELPPDNWLVLSSNDVLHMGGDQAPGLRGRTIVSSGWLFPATNAGGDMIIFSPIKNGSTP